MALWSCVNRCMGQVITMGNFDVTVTDVSGYSFSFDTGSGMPDASNTVEIYVFTKCRIEGRGQEPVGAFFPHSTVPGIQAEVSGVAHAPGAGTTISYKFVEGIEQNADVYTKHEETNTATLTFCVEIGLYTNGFLSNWEEIKVHYNVDLTTDINNQGEPVVFVASASNFLASLGLTSLSENGIASFFCDPHTQAEVAPGTTMRQGKVISICFNVVEGEDFEVEDIMDLIVEDLGDSQASQSIIIANEYAPGGYADKFCKRTSPTTETCVVSFLLRAAFYDYEAAELAGEGAALVELGAAGERKRRQLVRFGIGPKNGGVRRLSDTQAVAPTSIKPKEFKVERVEGFNHKIHGSSGAAVGLSLGIGLAWATASVLVGFHLV